MDGSRERQGALGNLEDKTIDELKRLLKEQKRLQKNSISSKMSDGGGRITEKIAYINQLLEKKTQPSRTVVTKATLDDDDGMEQLTQEFHQFDIQDPEDLTQTGKIPDDLTPAELKQLEASFLGDHLLPPIDNDSSIPIGSQYNFFMFDLETSGLGHDAEIVQIAVVDHASLIQRCTCVSAAFSPTTDNDSFSCYCLPTHIDPGATGVTGFRLEHLTNSSGDTRNRLVNRDGDELSTRPLDRSLLEMCHFVNSRALESNRQPVLVAHFGHGFDFPILMNSMSRAHVDPSQLDHWLLLDTCAAVKILKQPRPHKLGDLVARLCPSFEFRNAHDALGDCRALAAVVNSLGRTVDELVNLGSSVTQRAARVQLVMSHKRAQKSNKASFTNHSVPLTEPLCRAGFNFDRIRSLVLEGGWRNFAALTALPSERPRVSRHLPSLVRLFQHMQRMHSAITRESKCYVTEDTRRGQVCGFSSDSQRSTKQLSMTQSLQLMTESGQEFHERTVADASNRLERYNASQPPSSAAAPTAVVNRYQYREQEELITDDEDDYSDQDSDI